MQQNLRNSFRLGLSLSAALCVPLLPGCNGSGSDGVNTFATKAAGQASASSSPVVVEGRLMVYLASEALSGVGGTNFNPGDVDFNDDCAVVVDMVSGTETELLVATTAAKIVGTNVYLMVSETADAFDWSGANGLNDTVLLHFSSTSPLSFVSTMEPGANSWASASGNLYFVRADNTGLVNGDSTLALLAAAAPTTPVTVLQTDVGNIIDVRVLAVDESLMFLTADETVEGNLNGDADSTDPFVLALLDTKLAANPITNVGLSVKDLSTPVRAKATGADWRVAFLVEENTQSNFATGLNDPTLFAGAWKPSGGANCGAGYNDVDKLDNVLHVLNFAAWIAAPLVNPPVNTGIAGVDRILVTSNTIATLVNEVDDGGCDLNNDGDNADKVLRWTLAATPQLPFVNSTQINAVEDGVPGGTRGISDLSNRLIMVVSEADDNTDHDADTLKTHNLVAWLNPTAGVPAWVFDHGSQVGIQPAGASGMSDRIERDRLLIAFQESVIDLAINSGDTDKLDSTPTFARFDPSNSNDFDFPGPAVAVSATNPGLVLANGFALYRVDEAADNRDWNGDAVKNDFVLFRTSTSTNFSALVGSGARATTNSIAGPIVFSGGTIGAAYLADESMAGVDINTDGRSDGFIVTWFRIG